MKDIDFLPVGYRRQHALRFAHLWRAAVIGLFGLLLAGTILMQNHRRRAQEDSLATTQRVHDQTKQQVDELGRLQRDQAAAEQDAHLIAYLRHPWPRTRILAAVLTPLPDEITLERLALAQAVPTDVRSPASVAGINSEAEQGRRAQLAPAARDLEDLRKQADSTQTRITLSGETTEPEALHRYLATLGRSPLVAKADLDSLESEEKNGNEADTADGPMRFSATIVIRPGYGQPGGPTGSTEHVARSDSAASPPIPQGQP